MELAQADAVLGKHPAHPLVAVGIVGTRKPQLVAAQQKTEPAMHRLVMVLLEPIRCQMMRHHQDHH